MSISTGPKDWCSAPSISPKTELSSTRRTLPPVAGTVTLVVVLFSVIQTFADFQIVYVMTGGGPANATHLFGTYAYQIGVGTGLLSEGAAIALAMFPILFLVVIVQLLYIRRVETR